MDGGGPEGVGVAVEVGVRIVQRSAVIRRTATARIETHREVCLDTLQSPLRGKFNIDRHLSVNLLVGEVGASDHRHHSPSLRQRYSDIM